MARPNKIWFRKDIGWWFVTINGRKIRLAEGKGNRKLAEQKFHELKATQQQTSQTGGFRIADVIENFLAWSDIHRSAETNRNLVYYGQKFAEHIGYLSASELKPHHLTQWVDSHEWGQTTQRNARRSIYRPFSWAVEEGLLNSNPLKGMKCPGALARQRAMTDEEFRALLRGSKREFKILLFALRATGCRPKEARMLTWDQIHEDRWVLAEHKTAHKVHRPRVIYLIKPMQRLMTVLRHDAAEQGLFTSKVFLNARLQPWTVNAIRLRMERVKRRMGLADDLCAYMARHAFGTSAILNGVDGMTVAQIMGHSSMEMIQRVYVHLSDQHDHLHRAVEQAAKAIAPPKRPPADLN